MPHAKFIFRGEYFVRIFSVTARLSYIFCPVLIVILHSFSFNLFFFSFTQTELVYKGNTDGSSLLSCPATSGRSLFSWTSLLCPVPKPTHRHTMSCCPKCNGIKDEPSPDVRNNSHMYFVYMGSWVFVGVCVCAHAHGFTWYANALHMLTRAVYPQCIIGNCARAVLLHLYPPLLNRLSLSFL